MEGSPLERRRRTGEECMESGVSLITSLMNSSVSTGNMMPLSGRDSPARSPRGSASPPARSRLPVEDISSVPLPKGPQKVVKPSTSRVVTSDDERSLTGSSSPILPVKSKGKRKKKSRNDRSKSPVDSRSDRYYVDSSDRSVRTKNYDRDSRHDYVDAEDRDREYREFAEFREFSRRRERKPRDVDRDRERSSGRDRRREDRYDDYDDRKIRARHSRSRSPHESRRYDRRDHRSRSKGRDRSQSAKRSKRAGLPSQSRGRSPRATPSSSCASRPISPPPQLSIPPTLDVAALAEALLPDRPFSQLAPPRAILSLNTLDTSNSATVSDPAAALVQIPDRAFHEFSRPASPSPSHFAHGSVAGESELVEEGLEFEDDEAEATQPASSVAPSLKLLLKEMVEVISPLMEEALFAEPSDVPLPPALGMISGLSLGEVYVPETLPCLGHPVQVKVSLDSLNGFANLSKKGTFVSKVLLVPTCKLPLNQSHIPVRDKFVGSTLFSKVGAGATVPVIPNAHGFARNRRDSRQFVAIRGSLPAFN
eukprot:GHVU01023124.1.p1 GENE.GHVU01023124.1~~GHVU01023124.1.p1  ORF type:complete len:537 (-),score=0.53 GHVU01023124.1:143-1753(-)